MDRKLLLLINQQWINPAADRLMAVLSSTDLWAPVFVVVGLLLLWRGSFQVRTCLLIAGLAAGVSDGLICHPLKQWVGRPRPPQEVAGVRQVDLAKARPRFLALSKPARITYSAEPQPGLEGRSFPSSHTANLSAFTFVVALFFRQRGWLAGLVPLFVGYSRIYNGAHWPSDVAVSLFLGAAIGLACTLVASALWRRFGARWLPQVHAAHPALLSAT